MLLSAAQHSLLLFHREDFWIEGCQGHEDTSRPFNPCLVSPGAFHLFLPIGPGPISAQTWTLSPCLSCVIGVPGSGSTSWSDLRYMLQVVCCPLGRDGPLGSCGGMASLPGRFSPCCLQSIFWPGLLLFQMVLPRWTLDLVHHLPFYGLLMHLVISTWLYLQQKTGMLWDMLIVLYKEALFFWA